MKQPELRLGALPPIRVSGGTLVTVGLLALLVHPAVARVPGIGPGTALAVAIGIGAFMIVSVAVHELAHALTAIAFGAKVDHMALTLWGGHTQYSGGRLRSWHSILISLVGPVANAVIGAAAAWSEPLAAGSPALAVFLYFAATLNYALAVFNLLPGLPMDGGRALEGVLTALTRAPGTATRITAWIGRGIAALVGGCALWRVLADPDGGSLLLLLWGLLIASMLWQGASSALRTARLEERVGAADLSRLLRPARVLSAEAPVAVLDGTDPSTVLVDDGAGGIGLVDARALASVPEQARTRTPLRAVSAPLPVQARLRLPLSGTALVATMLARPYPVYLVVDEQGRVRGTVRAADVDAHLHGRRPAL